jgi:leucyl/phenylalanyl-tRNA---protein transferase
VITYLLRNSIVFPPAEEADDDGLLALGGDLSVERLIAAYSNGIFPWYDETSPILWWSPDPRMVLFPEEFIVSHSLRQTLRKNTFRVTFDLAFEDVIDSCSRKVRPGQNGTWIVPEMKEAYIRYHDRGYAHSVEVWQNGILAGGLYGVSIGRIFCGESMFYNVTNASKVAFFHLTGNLKKNNFVLIDAQLHTSHLESLGARLIERRKYLEILKENIGLRDEKSIWENFEPIPVQ